MIQQKILNIAEWQLSQCFRSQSPVMELRVQFLASLSTSASRTFIYQVVQFVCKKTDSLPFDRSNILADGKFFQRL